MHGIVQDGLQDAAIPEIGPPSDYFTSPPEDGPAEGSASSRASSESDTSLQQLTGDVEECVNCLIRLVPVLRDPAPQDIHKQTVSQSEVHEDVELARRMFPQATTLLLRRLGVANWKRRQTLLGLKSSDRTNTSPNRSSKRDNHRRPDIRQSAMATVMKPSSWIAAFSPQPLASNSDSSHTGAASIDDSVFSQSDYFSSRSVTSVAASDQVTWVKHYEVPAPPVALKFGSSFDCPYCGQEIIVGLQVTSTEDWNSHVLLDLEPYVCTFDDCLHSDKSFGMREDWFQHELDYHRLRKIWFCQSCDHNFDEVEDIELHLNEKHKDSDDSRQLSLMISLCERYSDEGIPGQACPFCRNCSESAKALEKHIASHMEQFTLSFLQHVHDSGKGADACSDDAISIDKKAKLELLNNFVEEQRGYFWKPPQEENDDGTTNSNVAFAEDSDDEAVHQDVHFARAEPLAMKKSGRPAMQRRGDSWMKRVNDFLDNQPADQSGKTPWLSRVQTYLGTPSAEEGPMEESKAESPIASLIQSPFGASNPPPTPLVPPRCLRTNQPPRDKEFVGRDSDFAKIHENLSHPGTCSALSGAGGMGKTQTAIEYTYRHENTYSYIFWISAETAVSCADTYSLIATEFLVSGDDIAYEQGRLISLGRDFLEQTDSRWLLVFDNVTSWYDIRQYIPTRPDATSGSILITSRKPDIVDATSMPHCQSLELEALTLEESRLFLLSCTHPDLKNQKASSHPEYNIAGVIAKEAEGLPLALAHIAGYVQVSKCTLTDFVQLWNERRRNSRSVNLSANSSMLSTDKALETVWTIGLREVTIDARELLNILAFLDSDCIQRKLLVGEHEEPSLDFLHSDQAFRFGKPLVPDKMTSLIPY